MPANPPLSSNQPLVQDQLLERTCSSSSPSPGLTKDHFISTDTNSRQHVLLRMKDGGPTQTFGNKQLLSRVASFRLFFFSVHQARCIKVCCIKYVGQRFVLCLLQTTKPFL